MQPPEMPVALVAPRRQDMTISIVARTRLVLSGGSRGESGCGLLSVIAHSLCQLPLKRTCPGGSRLWYYFERWKQQSDELEGTSEE